MKWTDRIRALRRRMVFKLSLIIGLTLLASVVAWAYLEISHQKEQMMDNLALEADRLSTTIKLGAHYAMMLNSRGDIAEIIKNVSRQPDIKAIRIYNKEGEIQYSDQADEVGRETNIKDEACYVCHRTDPPQVHLSLEERTRVFTTREGGRVLGIIGAIYNEPGCAAADCHVHPPDKQVLGALDMVLSLQAADKELAAYTTRTIISTTLIFLLIVFVVLIFILRYVNRPVAKMIQGAFRIAQGDHFIELDVGQRDEMGQLAEAITQMGWEIGRKQAELRRQRREYQNLFETVPCLITIQDRRFKLINYNREFADKFDPQPGDYCYHAYKGRHSKCDPCPVEKTFADGRSHTSEETGYNRDGTLTHWMVITSPVFDEEGHIVSAMEINLDITSRKLLEQELEKSEQKYHAFFNNIPNPVFVLDQEDLRILDCNDSVVPTYGLEKREVLGRRFTDLYYGEFNEAEEVDRIRDSSFIRRVKQRHKDGRPLFVNIRISPSEYDGRRVLLVTTSDITKRLEAEQQLNQASKMATLGEMATGVAHELNQPLSVIKTVSSFFIKKINQGGQIDPQTLNTMLTKVDANVDRAAKIIGHMRLFARKSEMKLAKVRINEVLSKASDMFTEQLRARGVELNWDLQENLPPVHADPDRLEQVFVNLIINARDAIEQRFAGQTAREGDKHIDIKTHGANGKVIVEVQDSGGGVEPGLADKIFDPFFTTKEVGKGTGLGLSISYGIVRDCHGDIRLDDKAKEGARFIIEFPAEGENHVG